MRILITGFSGFVARYFVEYLVNENIEAEVLGIDVNEPQNYIFKSEKVHILSKVVNLLNYDQLCNICKEFSPEYVLHLAAFSSVSYSWKYPQESFLNNTNIFLNLVEAIRHTNIKCRLLSVGSSEEYGNISEGEYAFAEKHILNPISPYAVARVSQEMLSRVYVEGYGMDIVLTRSFNHIGPGQNEKFVVPGFVKKVYDIYKSGEKSGIIETGDTSIIRDFLDVRDVVRAYFYLLLDGTRGEIYNVCSGKGVILSDIIKMVADYYRINIETKVNNEYIRPNENKVIIGNNLKIRNDIGWKPWISLQTSIYDICYSMDK